MLRSFGLAVCLLVACLGPLAAQTFSWYSALAAPASDGWYQVDLGPEVLSRLRADFGDLRLVEIQGPDTVEVPFVLKTWADDSVWFPAEFELLNVGDKRENTFETYRVGESQVINRISLAIDAQTYDLLVMVEGSANRITWNPIVTSKKLRGTVQQQDNFRQESITFDSIRTRFVRIQHQPGEIPVRIRDIGYFEYKDGRTTRYAVKNFQEVEVPADNTTEVMFDLGKRLPVSIVQFKMSGTRDFFREGILYMATDTTAQGKVNWVKVKNFSISSLQSPEIAIPLTFGRHWKAVIRHEDNLPIRVAKVEPSAPVFSMLVDLRRGSSYGLKFGSNEVSKPRYDLNRLVEKLDLDQLPVLRAGNPVSILPEGSLPAPPSNGPQSLFQSSGINYGWYIGGGVALVVLVLVLRRFFRSFKSKTGPEKIESNKS